MKISRQEWTDEEKAESVLDEQDFWDFYQAKYGTVSAPLLLEVPEVGAHSILMLKGWVEGRRALREDLPKQ